jgi:hypothetical protein
MLKTLTITGSLILASTGFAQQTLQAKQVPARLQKAGVYHVATGTWTHGSQETLTPANKRFYLNSANSGFFGVMGVGVDLIWTDEGCVPGSGHTGTALAKDGPFEIQSIDFGYCSNALGAFAQTGGFLFYDLYASCTNPASLTPIANLGFAVPGAGTSGGNCWLVTFDLTASSAAFNMSDDGDGVFDSTTSLDNFGWTLIMNDAGSGGFNGPLLRGDPNAFPYGDGTYYQNSGATYATGLDTRDQFWLSDPTATYVNGCYWFGGYAGGNPFASFWLALDGKNVSQGGGTKYCIANPNSTGAPADISRKDSGGTAQGPPFIKLSCSPVPNQAGIFFKANNVINPLVFGCGFLCTSGGLVRGNVVFASGNRMEYEYDHSNPAHDLRNRVGQTQSFQCWFRDPMGCSSAYNTSNAWRMLIN